MIEKILDIAVALVIAQWFQVGLGIALLVDRFVEYEERKRR